MTASVSPAPPPDTVPTTKLGQWAPKPHFVPEAGQSVAWPPIDEGLSLVSCCRRIAVLTEGHAGPEYAKTAVQLLRYRPHDIAAVVDSEHAGKVAQDVFGLGGSVPIVASVQAVQGIDAVFVGISPPGGAAPPAFTTHLVDALRLGLPIVSGLHEPLAMIPAVGAALGGSGRIVELRRGAARHVATGAEPNPTCLRVLTVGTDCSVGKMSAAKEIEIGLRRRGRDALFLATGQTGMMIGGEGLVIDAVVSDFVNGAVERLVLSHEDREILLVEGQGSIVHPAYSAVSTGLLHGAAPDALILCHEAGRERLKSCPAVPVTPLEQLVHLHELLGGVRRECRVIGVAINGRRLDAAEGPRYIERIERELGLPACDVYRDGPGRLVDAVEKYDGEVRRRRGLPTAARRPMTASGGDC